MSSELVYRMRTCSAALLASNYGEPPLLHRDAANLLAEASNLLDTPDELGDVMEALEMVAHNVGRSSATWTSGGELPAATPRPCPTCGNIGARKVRISHRKLLLTCPTCAHEWEYAP